VADEFEMASLPTLGCPLRRPAALWILGATVMLVTPGLGVRADMHRYTDDSGWTYIVDNIEKIPPQYPDRVKSVSTPSSTEAGSSSQKGGYPAKPSPSGAQPPVDIYVTSWCGYCQKLEKFLKAQGIRYERHDIEKSRSAHERYRSLGGSGVPLIKVGSDVIRGYGPDAILSSLKKQR
jgi:glutaredoxin